MAEYGKADVSRTIQVKVKPNARQAGLEELSDGTWIARVKSPPVDGKANKELIALWDDENRFFGHY